MKSNTIIRNTAKEKGVCLWQVADELGVSDVAFSKMLRHELPQEKREKILGIIGDLARIIEGVER